jgi:hypothetical protein
LVLTLPMIAAGSDFDGVALALSAAADSARVALLPTCLPIIVVSVRSYGMVRQPRLELVYVAWPPFCVVGSVGGRLWRRTQEREERRERLECCSFVPWRRTRDWKS